MEFHVCARQFVLETGDSCCFDGSIKHYYLNRGTEAAELVCAIPPTFAYTNHLQLGRRIRS